MRWLLACGVLLANPSWAMGSTVPDDFATIQAALDAAAPGETVSVKDTASPYFEKIAFPTSGAPGAYITLQAFPGHSPVLDGTGVPGSNMVLIDSKSYVKIIGFEIRNNLNVNDGSGIRVVGSGSHIEIRNNRIHAMRGRDAMGVTVYGTAATSIANLVIDGNEIYECEPARSEALTLNGNVELFEVTNNVVRDVNNIGIDFIGGETDIQPDPAKVARNGICRGNRVYRARSIYGGGFAGGIYVDGGKDIVIERNIVSESDLGIEIGAENSGIVASGIVVRDNVVYRNDKAGLVFGGFASSVGRVQDSFFLNNTLFQNDILNTGLGELWIQYAEDNVIRNNIFYGTAQSLLLYSEVGNVNNTLDYNLWFADAGAGSAIFVWRGTEYGGYSAYQSGSGQDVHSVFGDPQFLDGAAADFHLRSASPAVNAGDPAFAPGTDETDIDGAPRVSGGRVDIGADEVTCGDRNVNAGEDCDDGNLTDCDGCDSNCTLSSVCGNGIVCAPEQCDAPNPANGDCCSASCEFEPAGSTCDDAEPCTTDACDGAGACVGLPAPATGCRQPLQAGKAKLVIKRDADGKRDSLLWTWAKGAQTSLVDFGDPVDGSTSYTLCMYDESQMPGALLLSARAPAAGTCNARPCWKDRNGRGYGYKDTERTPDGLQTVLLKPGEAGRAKIIVSGRGPNLELPALPLAASYQLSVQLRNSEGVCWEAQYSTPARRNETGRFDDRSD